MKEYWQQLSPRDRTRVLWLFAATAALLFYGLFWLPLQSNLQTLEQTVNEQHILLQWMRPAVARIQQLRQQGVTVVHTSADSVAGLEQALHTSAIATTITLFQQSSDGSVQVELKAVNFDRVIHWLEDYSRHSALQVEQFSAHPQAEPGLVDVHMVLKI